MHQKSFMATFSVQRETFTLPGERCAGDPVPWQRAVAWAPHPFAKNESGQKVVEKSVGFPGGLRSSLSSAISDGDSCQS